MATVRALFLLILLPWMSCAQKVDPPRIVFEETAVDLGRVFQGMTFPLTFRFRNEGGSDLNLGEAHFGCGCLRVEKPQSVIPPGGASEIRVVLQTSPLKGRSKQTVTVECNDPIAPRTVLQIESEVLSAFQVEPEILELGTVREGETREWNVTLRDAEGEPFRILSWKCPDASLRISSEPLEGSGGAVQVLKIALAPGGSARRIETFLALETERTRGPVRQNILIQGRVVAPIQCDPEVVFFGTHEAGDFPEIKVRVQNQGEVEGFLETVEGGEKPVLRVRSEIVRAGWEYELSLTVSPDVLPGRFFGDLLLRIQGRAQPIPIPYSGYVRKSQ